MKVHLPKQFDFSRNWRKQIAPILEKPAVNRALTLGLRLYDGSYERGDPPWLCGWGPLNGQRARRGCLSWHQPLGRCHHIAPFCWAIGRELHPELRWGFVSGDRHTVVVGYQDDWQEPELVMDILLFRRKSGQESLDWAMSAGGRFYDSLARYAASFCKEPEYAHKVFSDSLGGSDRRAS